MAVHLPILSVFGAREPREQEKSIETEEEPPAAMGCAGAASSPWLAEAGRGATAPPLAA
jgi:hypothetical protein